MIFNFNETVEATETFSLFCVTFARLIYGPDWAINLELLVVNGEHAHLSSMTLSMSDIIDMCTYALQKAFPRLR